MFLYQLRSDKEVLMDNILIKEGGRWWLWNYFSSNFKNIKWHECEFEECAEAYSKIIFVFDHVTLENPKRSGLVNWILSWSNFVNASSHKVWW